VAFSRTNCRWWWLSKSKLLMPNEIRASEKTSISCWMELWTKKLIELKFLKFSNSNRISKCPSRILIFRINLWKRRKTSYAALDCASPPKIASPTWNRASGTQVVHLSALQGRWSVDDFRRSRRHTTYRASLYRPKHPLLVLRTTLVLLI